MGGARVQRWGMAKALVSLCEELLASEGRVDEAPTIVEIVWIAVMTVPIVGLLVGWGEGRD